MKTTSEHLKSIRKTLEMLELYEILDFVDKQEKRIQILTKDRDALEVKIDKAYRNKHSYKQALEFYANEIQYEWVENYDGEKEFCIEADGGEKARQALEESE